MIESTAADVIAIVPANEASWDDLQMVLGMRGDPHRCQCQRYKLRPHESWTRVGVDELARRLREQTASGHPESGSTSGLVAYLDGEPAGWCAVEPRPAYPGLLRNARVPDHPPRGHADRFLGERRCHEFATSMAFPCGAQNRCMA